MSVITKIPRSKERSFRSTTSGVEVVYVPPISGEKNSKHSDRPKKSDKDGEQAEQETEMLRLDDIKNDRYLQYRLSEEITAEMMETLKDERPTARIPNQVEGNSFTAHAAHMEEIFLRNVASYALGSSLLEGKKSNMSDFEKRQLQGSAGMLESDYAEGLHVEGLEKWPPPLTAKHHILADELRRLASVEGTADEIRESRDKLQKHFESGTIEEATPEAAQRKSKEMEKQTIKAMSDVRRAKEENAAKAFEDFVVATDKALDAAFEKRGIPTRHVPTVASALSIKFPPKEPKNVSSDLQDMIDAEKGEHPAFGREEPHTYLSKPRVEEKTPSSDHKLSF